jgi:hypothetical protein
LANANAPDCSIKIDIPEDNHPERRTSMRTRSLLLMAFGILLAFTLHTAPAQAQATRTWISGVGDDVNPCSRTAPCKTFAGAISKTAAGGEIDCLDPGGFGAVTITKAITLDCTFSNGSILASGTNGIVVSAGVNDIINIRGLSIDGSGTGLDAIKFLAGAQLSVEHCFIVGFTQNGVEVATSAAADIYVTNTYITNVNKGVLANTSSGTSIVVVNNAYILNTGTSGFEAKAGIVGTIENSTITSAPNAVITTGGSQVNVESSTLVNNTTAINVSVGGGFIRVANNAIYNNGTNFNNVGGTIASAGNNRITAGGSTTPNATITQQ